MKAKFSLGTFSPGTGAGVVKVNTPFDLLVVVQDLRPNGTYFFNDVEKPLIRGVYAAYMNVLFNKELVGLATVEQQTIRFVSGMPMGMLRLQYAGKTIGIQYDNRNLTSRGATASKIAKAVNLAMGFNLVTCRVGSQVNTYLVSFTGQPGVDEKQIRSLTKGVVVSTTMNGDEFNPMALNKCFTFSPLYQNGITVNNLLDNTGFMLGSFFSGDFSRGLGTNPIRLCTVSMIAKKVGVVEFTPNINVEVPIYAPLLFGNIAAQKEEESGYITKEDVQSQSTVLEVIA